MNFFFINITAYQGQIYARCVVTLNIRRNMKEVSFDYDNKHNDSSRIAFTVHSNLSNSRSFGPSWIPFLSYFFTCHTIKYNAIFECNICISRTLKAHNVFRMMKHTHLFIHPSQLVPVSPTYIRFVDKKSP